LRTPPNKPPSSLGPINESSAISSVLKPNSQRFQQGSRTIPVFRCVLFRVSSLQSQRKLRVFLQTVWYNKDSSRVCLPKGLGWMARYNEHPYFKQTFFKWGLNMVWYIKRSSQVLLTEVPGTINIPQTNNHLEIIWFVQRLGTMVRQALRWFFWSRVPVLVQWRTNLKPSYHPVKKSKIKLSSFLKNKWFWDQRCRCFTLILDHAWLQSIRIGFGEEVRIVSAQANIAIRFRLQKPAAPI